MTDITSKTTSLRTAVASATVLASRPETIAAVISQTVPKGDVREFSRAAGLLAIKRTSDVIPDCHPLPIEHASITWDIQGLAINIACQVRTVYKTGVEVEAMHGAMIAALTAYDMLKPIDKHIEIASVKLIEKKGGKTERLPAAHHSPKTAVVVCSDTIASGAKTDQTGKAIAAKLQKHTIAAAAVQTVPDEIPQIQQQIQNLCNDAFDLIVVAGGTGLSPRDVTPEAIAPLIDRIIPGITEAARAYGQSRTPYAMLSRAIAGMRGNTLIITLPGSTRGAEETIDALFPAVLHVFAAARGERHD